MKFTYLVAADRSIFPFLCSHSLRMPCPQIIRPWRRACLHRSLLLLIWCMASQTKRTSSSSALKYMYVQSTVIHIWALLLKLHTFGFCKCCSYNLLSKMYLNWSFDILAAMYTHPISNTADPHTPRSQILVLFCCQISFNRFISDMLRVCNFI